MTDKGEKVRIKQKYAEYIRIIADERGDTFLDALYYMLDSFWQTRRGLQVIQPPKPVIEPSTKPTTTPKEVTKPVEVDDIDVSDFE